MSSKHGHLIVVSAPSGAGKSTLVHAALAHLSDLVYSVSYTTRAARGQERHGLDYFFVTMAEFQRMREAGQFLESAEVHDNWYGTARHTVQQHLDEGRNVILDIDVQGAAQIRKALPHTISIFVLPPSFAELEQRLRDRNTDNRYDVEKRLQNARGEVERYREFDYVIVNDDRTTAAQALMAIIAAVGQQRRCQEAVAQQIIETFPESLGGETLHA